jgi:hypothetical protein
MPRDYNCLTMKRTIGEHSWQLCDFSGASKLQLQVVMSTVILSVTDQTPTVQGRCSSKFNLQWHILLKIMTRLCCSHKPKQFQLTVYRCMATINGRHLDRGDKTSSVVSLASRYYEPLQTG